MQLTYPPPESLEVKYAEDSRSEEYPEDFDGYNTEYPDNQNPGNRGHAIHTETTHDYGRFLSDDYKSKLEKQAEEMIKRKKAQNATNTKRPPSNGEQNRHESPKLYYGYQQTGNTAFFRLGNIKNPIMYKFPEVIHKPNDERHIYLSEEHTNGEKYSPKEPPTPSSERQYYIQKTPISSTETNHPQFSYTSKRHPFSHTLPPDSSSLYYYSTEQYNPTYSTPENRNPSTYSYVPRQYSTSTEHPLGHHNSKNKYTHSYTTKYNQPTDYLRSQYYNSEKKLPLSNYNQQNDNIAPVYYSDKKKSPVPYLTNYNQPTDNLPPPYHGSEKKSQISYSTNYNHPTENLPSQYHSNEKKSEIPYSTNYNNPIDNLPPQHHNIKKSQIPYSANYNQPTENLPPQYHSIKKKSQILYSTNYNQPNENLPSEYSNSEMNAPISYTPNYNQLNTLPPTRESYNNPSEYTLTPVPYNINSPEHSMSPPNQPYIKNEDVSQERDFYMNYKSLLDFYRSHGFHPLNLDKMEDFSHSRFVSRNPFYSKIEISNPLSGSISSSEDYISNLKNPQYTLNADIKSPYQQNQGNYQTKYENSRYSEEAYQEQNHFQPELKQLPTLNKEPYYHEHISYDSNRSPITSDENLKTQEISRPVIFNAQIESPKETFSLEEFPTKFHSSPTSTESIAPEEKKIKALRIMDYNSDSFFGNPTEKSVDKSAGLEFSSYSVPLDIPSHSIVRKNPYLSNSNSEESAKYNERPRIYREKISIIDAEENQSINSKSSKFRTSNIIDISDDIIHSDSSFAHDSIDNQQNYNLPKSENYPVYNQWNSESTITPTSLPDHKVKIYNNRKGGGAAKQNSRQNHEKSKIKGKQQKRSGRTRTVIKVRSKKHRKRSSHKRQRKHKPSKRSQGEDQLKAEGSTYHWGMEKHKGTDGFFQ